jgi:DNA-binding XRE family transcriptional regulator
MSHETINRGGKTYFLVEQGEYERAFGVASSMPPLPGPSADGTVDAVGYARASIAREIIGRRLAAGMTQTALAKAAGVRVETLNRIENARHTADVATIAKLDAVLPALSGGAASSGGGRRKAFGLIDAPANRTGAKSGRGTHKRTDRKK